ncbi:rRNA adenine dimethyltransferase family protein [Mycoplasma sp. ATU-Cv-508]|uniref:rRNA adenine N-6-methyltransferase family protein n=1 Tax=Mycoplasma sp. ATU-Cv-508 TaxID=2048001 RepID=UPI000FDDFFDC
MKTPAGSSAKKPLSPSEIVDIWNQIAFRPTRGKGQNFLVDLIVLDRISQLVSNQKWATIVEIGAGLGALTPFLIHQAAKVVSYEIDSRLAQFLKKRLSFENWTLVEDDFLKSDLSQFQKPLLVVGNIPYSLTAPILFHLFRFSDSLSQAILMVQKEVGLRLAAQPGQSNYGKLTLSANLFCQVKLDQSVFAKQF